MHNYLFFNIVLVVFGTFFSGFESYAKSYLHKEILEWDASPEKITINEQTDYTIYGFEGANFSSKKLGLAEFIQSYPIESYGSVQVNLQNEVFETVPAHFIPMEVQKQISSSIEIKSSIEKAQAQYYADVKIIPFRKSKNGQLQKLVSFELQIEFNPIQKRELSYKYADNSKLSTGDWYKVEVGCYG